MKASILLTNHNYARYVVAAVDSALSQTHGDTDVVVVDDGSGDGSRPLLTRYGDRIRLILQEQSGQTAALNRGLNACTGEVVVLLDADDVLYPDAVARAVGSLHDGGWVKVHSPVVVIGADGQPTGGLLPAAELPHGDVRQLALRDGPHTLAFPPTSGSAWSRSFLDGVFPLPELERSLGVGSASADALLSMLACVTGPVAALPTPLAAYRVHGANDYAGSPLPTRVARHVRVLDAHFGIVERYCADRGGAVDVDAWRRTSWFHRVAAVRATLLAHVPTDCAVVLVDGGEWGQELLPDHRVLPFVEHEGTWWGPPENGTVAVNELRRLQAAGATYVAVAWQCWWWRDAYPELFAYLDEVAHPLVRNADVQLFRLADDERSA